MVFRTIEIKEISYEVKKEKQKEVIKRVQDLYPDLKISVKGDKVSVSGDLRNYRKRDMIVYILSGGEHGTSI